MTETDAQAEDGLPLGFAERVVRRSPGGELYFDLATGYELIEACRSGDFAIIGVEGFQVLAEGLRSKMDLIADFSALSAAPWAVFQESGSRFAKAFLDSIEDRAVIVTFVTLSRAETERKRTTP